MEPCGFAAGIFGGAFAGIFDREGAGLFAFHFSATANRESILWSGLNSEVFYSRYPLRTLGRDEQIGLTFLSPVFEAALALGIASTSWEFDLWIVDARGLRLSPDPDPDGHSTSVSLAHASDPRFLWIDLPVACTTDTIEPSRLRLLGSMQPTPSGEAVWRAIRTLLLCDLDIPWWAAVPGEEDAARFEFWQSDHPGVSQAVARPLTEIAGEPNRLAADACRALLAASPLPFERAVPFVKAASGAYRSPFHGLRHWRRIACYGRELACSVEGADKTVVELFALFHDAQRVHDGNDVGHGERGARLARELRGEAFELTDAQMEQLTEACSRHTDGETTADSTIGVCWDADRLDLPRVGMAVESRFLSTEAARNLATAE